MGINITDLSEAMDYMARVYVGTLGTGTYGVGEPGDSNYAAGAADDLVTAILGMDSDVVLKVHTKAVRQAAALSAVRVGTWSDVLNSLNDLCRASGLTGVTNLNTYLTYYNTGSGGPNNGLQHQAWREMHYRWKGSYPTATNLYFECKRNGYWAGTTFTNALFKYDVTGAGTGTPTSGYSITTNYAGGKPYLNVTGFAGASATVTVTGTQDLAGVRTTGKTWTASVSGDGTVALTAGTAHADALIAAVSSVSVGAAMTNGDIYVEAWKPSGRLSIPA